MISLNGKTHVVLETAKVFLMRLGESESRSWSIYFSLGFATLS